MSPRYVLAAAIRALNARLCALPVEQQAAIQPDWLDAWDCLTAEREAAPDEQTELHVIRTWATHWTRRLGE
jgi:hypothetical protein